MKKYYVTWINEDQDQIEGRKPHNAIRDDGELTDAETAEEAVENVIQWTIKGEYDWFNDFGNDDIEIDEGSGDIIVWGIIIVWGVVGGNRKFIRAYVDFKAIVEGEEDAE